MAAKFPLFKGATRVPCWFFVPRTVLLGTFMFCGALYMFIHLYAMLLFALLWMVEYAITKHDERMFRILWLWIITKVRNRFDSRLTALWKGSSFSPVSYIDRIKEDHRDEV